MATQCLLKSFGFKHLTPAENAEQAIQLMTQAETPFDLLLCDQCLPDLSGLELIEIASHRGLITGRDPFQRAASGPNWRTCRRGIATGPAITWLLDKTFEQNELIDLIRH